MEFLRSKLQEGYAKYGWKMNAEGINRFMKLTQEWTETKVQGRDIGSARMRRLQLQSTPLVQNGSIA